MKLNGLDLNKLLIFSAVARHSGYKGAAEELSLTRSAISQAITNLEEVLGKRLFNRVGVRLQLTESARELHLELIQHHQNLQQAIIGFTKRGGRVEGQLRVGAYLEFAKSKLMPVIEEFMIENPGVQLKFVFDSPSKIRALLESDKIDLSISIFPHQKSKAIESKKLYQEELVLIGRTDLISHHPSRATLLKLPIIDYYASHVLFKRWWYSQYTSHLKKADVITYAATAEMVYEMVRRRLGIGVVPRYVLDSVVRDDRVQIIKPTENRLFDYVWLSQFKNKDRNPAHAEFLKLLHRRFSG